MLVGGGLFLGVGRILLSQSRRRGRRGEDRRNDQGWQKRKANHDFNMLRQAKNGGCAST
jgi:hypothetical protein